MNLLNGLISEEIISALGWTIVHSLWQGALVAVMLASLLVILRKSESRIRSLVSIGALVIFLALTVRTFIDTYNQSIVSGGENFVLVQESAAVEQPAESAQILQVSMEENSIIDRFFAAAREAGNYFKRHLNIIVTFWLMGVLLLTLKLIGGFTYSQRLKNYKTFPVSEKWDRKFNKLCERIDLRRPVKFAESAIVKVPVAIGYLKPVILLPLGTLTGLPASQVEAILLHELAHIYRADYIINIIQSIIETIFFYHPAVWWMSSAIRKERENCCDDIAVEVTGDSFNYAKALVNIQAFGSGESGLAMAAIGKNEKLFRRINRMILKQKTPGLSGKLGAAAILLVSLFAATLISCSSSSNDEFIRGHKEFSHLEEIEDFTTYKEGEKYLSFYEKDFGRRVHWEVYLEDGEIVKLYKNGDRIPDDELDDYRGMMDRKLTDLSEDMINLKEDLADMEIDLSGLDDELLTLKEELRDLDWEADLHRSERTRKSERARSRIRMDFDRGDLRESLRELREELKDLKISINDEDIDIDFDTDFDFDFDFDHDIDIDIDHDIDHALSGIRFNFDDDDLRINLEGLREDLADMRVNLRDLKINIPDLSDIKIDMTELNKELAKLKRFLDELKEELVDDGLIDDVDERFTLEYENGSIYIDNQRLSDDLTEKYKKMYEDYFGKELNEDSIFRIH